MVQHQGGILGSGKRDVREIEILGRSLRCTDEGLEYEASDKHRQALGWGLSEKYKTVNSAAVKKKFKQTKYASHAGQSGEEEFPELGGDVELRELGQIRCAILREGNMHEYGESDTVELEETEGGSQISERNGNAVLCVETRRTVDVHVDSDRAKGPERSTSGGMMTKSTVVKQRSGTQATRALRTAEAEHYAVITRAAEALIMSMMTHLGLSAQVRVWTDSNAKANPSRRGLGKTRHVELERLWLHEVAKSGSVIRRVPGEQHVADLLTYGISWRQMNALIRRIGGRKRVSQTEGTKKSGRSGRECKALTRDV